LRVVEQVSRPSLPFDKQQVDKIVALHEDNKTKDEVVKELKTEMVQLQSATADQLTSLMQHIVSLQDRVQSEVRRKEEERTQWEHQRVLVASAEQGTPDS